MPGGRFLIRLSVSALRRRPVLGRPRQRNGEGGAPDVMTAAPERSRDRRMADEQAALRRVGVLVARGAPPGEVFAAVTEEAGRLLGAGHAAMSRYDPDGAVRVVAAWSSTGAAVPVGTRVGVGGRNVHTLVFRTGRAARLDDYAGVSGAAADVAREVGFRAAGGAAVSGRGPAGGVLA